MTPPSTTPLGLASGLASVLAVVLVLTQPVAIAAGDDGADRATPPTDVGIERPSTASDEPKSSSDGAGEAGASAAPTFVVDEAFLARCAAAAEYSERATGRTMLVMHRGEIVFERYGRGVTERSHSELASGTKSFVGILAMAAVEDGLLDLDERASDTLTEWQDDASKRDITIRQILTLTSGIGSGSIGRPPSYAEAIRVPREQPTGRAFIYGPVPFQIFGEILRRKLVAAGNGEGVREYATRRLFDPIGIEIGAWRMGRDGQPHLPSGIGLTARDWAKFGEFVRNGGRVGDTQVIAAERIAECMRGTPTKTEYGLTWWLAWFDGRGMNPEELLQPGNTRARTPRDADIWMAAGLGKQRLYVIPSLELVIVRQATLAAGREFDDRTFIGMLIDLPEAAETVPARRRMRERPLRDRLGGGGRGR